MAKGKIDFLQECMSVAGPVPLDHFQMVWCRVCGNRQCERCGLNGSVFDRRVTTWQDTLFNKVPRARDDDPTVDGIRAKRFLPISADRAQSGLVPSFVTVQPKVPEQAPAQEAPAQEPPRPPQFVQAKPEEAEPAPDTDRNPEAAADLAPAPVPATPQPAPPPQPAEPDNTPFQQGMVLPGGQPKQEEKEVFIQPGGSFTFGED